MIHKALKIVQLWTKEIQKAKKQTDYSHCLQKLLVDQTFMINLRKTQKPLKLHFLKSYHSQEMQFCKNYRNL